MAFDEAGRYDLNSSERDLLERLGFDGDQMKSFQDRNIKIDKSRMQWGDASDE